jgi:hypothetical protein
MIDSPSTLAHRLNIDTHTLAIAAQQKGGVEEYLRRAIIDHGSMNVCCRGPNGKAERYSETWARITGRKWREK